jgi:hypothetical protein
MSDQPVLTTAAALNDFRHELIEGGYTTEQIGELATIALRAVVSNDGELIVRERVTA